MPGVARSSSMDFLPVNYETLWSLLTQLSTTSPYKQEAVATVAKAAILHGKGGSGIYSHESALKNNHPNHHL